MAARPLHRWLCALGAALAILVGARAAAAQSATARYQLGSKAFVGAPFVLAIVIDGFDEEPGVKAPSLAVPGLSIVPGEVDYRPGFGVTVNGRRLRQEGGTWVLTYRVTAERAGNFSLPSVTVAQGAATAEVRGANLEVVDLPTTNDMQLSLELPDRPVYIGESFDAELHWLLRKNPRGQQFDVPLLAMDGVISVQIPPPTNPRAVLEFATDKGTQELGFTQDRVNKNGATYDRLRFPLRLTARKSGKLTLPAAAVVADLEVGQGRDALGFPVMRTDTFRALDAVRTLDVRPVPETGKPPSFAGAVGATFAVSARASRSVVQLGEPLELELTVKSDQRLDGVQLAPLDGPGGLPKGKFALPSDAPLGELSDDGLRKTWKVAIQVTDATTTEIPGIAFSYFDPAKAAYQTIHTEPIALSVKGGAVVGAADVVGAPTGPGTPAPGVADPPALSLAGVDLALSSPGAGAGGLGRTTTLALIAILYAIPLAIFGWTFARRRGAARREVAGESKAALRALADEIDRARTAPAKEAALALSRQLAATARVVGTRVDGGLIARIENAGFAPDAAGEPLPSELRAELAELLDAWRREARRGPRPSAGAGAALLLVAAMGWPSSARADESERVGRAAYQDAMAQTEPTAKQRGFASAAAALARAVESEPTAARYTDLGNAALGAGDVGAAVLAYRRALRLDADHGRARRNLAWVRGRLPAELRPATGSATETLLFFHAWPRDRRLLLGALAFAVAVLVLVPWRGQRSRNLTPVAALAGLVWAAMTLSVLLQAAPPDDAVVMQSIVVRTADHPSSPASRATPLPAGVELRITEQRADWVRIRAGAVVGWIPLAAVERIERPAR